MDVTDIRKRVDGSEGTEEEKDCIEEINMIRPQTQTLNQEPLCVSNVIIQVMLC